MALDIAQFDQDFDPRFKTFHELMSWKIKDILLVSSQYDACIMEEDCRLAERIVNEYRGLNLSQPPRLTWASSAEEALAALDRKKFELVITMPRLADMDALAMGREIKRRRPDLPIILLTHAALADECAFDPEASRAVDRTFVWTGNSDLLLAQIKNVEDRKNVGPDTLAAGVRVIIFIEDSPIYLSSILPILYREVVSQTQGLLEEGLNEEHRLLTMRARAKILVAQTYEEAIDLYRRYRPFVLGVISDTRFPREGRLDENAGLGFLSEIKAEVADMPLLLTSSDPGNRSRAEAIPAVFVDKNSPTLYREIRSFFLDHLGFGDFVFRSPDGRELARASTRRALEAALPDIPDESFYYHWSRNDFSRWLFARTETVLASRLRPMTADDFSGEVPRMKKYLVESLAALRRIRQKGVVADFDSHYFDPEADFLKIGKGSLGGKARGLVFASALLQRNPEILKKYHDLEIGIPRTLVITTEGFDAFIEGGDLKELAKNEAPDAEIARRFAETPFPERITAQLRDYLSAVSYPLAVRSSGLLEDARYRAYAGLYRTYMIPNDHPDLETRLAHLISAVKLVYASTYFLGPKRFSRRVGQRTEEEKMAVIIQELVGQSHQGFFYPTLSGTAQSRNYYPFARIKPEDGTASICLGLGKTVVEGGRALRFSPRHPQVLPQFSLVDDILKNAQTTFYALKMGGGPPELDATEESALVKREVADAEDELPVKLVSSTYIPDEHRLKDGNSGPGPKVLTFVQILKYKSFPLADLLVDILALGLDGMGCPVEIEFSVQLCPREGCPRAFRLLQIRPMTARAEMSEVEILDEDIQRAFCFSPSALGNGVKKDMTDVVVVRPETFDPARTLEISREIGQLNAGLVREGRPYVLIGPGRWGSADHWLGIPVTWGDISGVGAIVEAATEKLKAEPSQGSHFFHNVAILGVSYLTVADGVGGFIDWEWLKSLPKVQETRFLDHIRLPGPLTLKVDGRNSHGVMLS
ncbi:MAG: PEP/pyruvate-binding domain-containing protein [Pseudomonadota bacterium]